MRNINEIKDRIGSIRETSQITKAMELISVSKLRKVTDKYLRNVHYYEMVRSTLKDIFEHMGDDVTHPYLTKRPIKHTTFLVIASDTGLCGDYNNKVLGFALSEIKKEKGAKSVITIGQMAREFFTHRDITPDVDFLYCAQDPSLNDAMHIQTEIVDLYDSKSTDRVMIIYTGGEEIAEIKPHIRQLLPLEREHFSEPSLGYSDPIDFEPNRKKVFDILVPQYILGKIYSALLQSVRSEHTIRMTTMNSATRNAEEMMATLELDFHRARQELITTEIAEISSSKFGG